MATVPPKPSAPKARRAVAAYKTLTAITAVRSRAEFYPTVVNGLAEHFDAAAAAVFVLAGDNIEAAVTRPRAGKYLELSINPQVDNVVTKVLATGRIINLPAAPATMLRGLTPLDRYAENPVLALPLTLNEKISGAAVLVGEGPAGEFSPEDQTEATLLASTAAAVWANIAEREKLTAEIERLAWEGRQLQSVLASGPVWFSGRVADAPFEQLLDEIRKGVAYTRAAVYLYDENAGTVRQVAARGFKPEEAKLAVETFKESLSYRALKNSEPLLVTDALAGDETAGGEVRGGSFLAVPLIRDHNRLGVVSLSSDQRSAFEQGDVDFVTALTAYAAAAFDSARRLDQARKRAAQLNLINEIGKKASFTQTPRELFAAIAAAIKEKFNYYSVAIYSLEAERGELILETIVGGYADVIPLGYRQRVDEGLVGAAAVQRRSVLVNDVSKDPRFVSVNAVMAQTKSELCTPILSRDEVSGVIDVQTRRLGAFEENDVVAMETIADKVGVVIENAALFREERRRASELALVNRLGQHILGAKDIPNLLRTVAEAIRKHFQYYNVSVFLVDEANPTMLKAGVIDGAYEKSADRATVIPFGRGFIGWAAQKGEVVLSNDAANDPRHTPDPISLDKHSEVCVPIKIGDRVVGVLNVQEKKIDAFTSHDVELFRMFADQIAIAIRNVNLLAAERRAAYEATTLLHLSHVISQTPDLDKSVDFLTEETATVMNADVAALVLVDAQDEPTVVKSSVGLSAEAAEELRASGLDLRPYPLYAEILSSAKPIFIPNLADDGRLPPSILPGFEAGSLLAAPIRKKNRLLGFLLAAWEEARPAVTKADLALFEGVAFQAAIGVENLNYFENVSDQTKYLSLLSSLAADASRLPPLAELLHVALQKIIPFAGADAGAVYLHDEKRQTLSLVAYFGVGDDVRLTWGLKDTIPAEKTATLLNTDVITKQTDDDADPLELAPAAEGGPGAYISVPLVAKQNVLGRVIIFSYRTRRFSSQGAEILQTICDQLSIFVENAQLFTQTSAQMKELLALMDTTKTFSSSLDPEEIIYSIAQKVKDLIGADECTVFLLDREAGTLDPIVSLTAYPEEVLKLRLKVGEGLTGHVALTGVGEYVNDAHADPRSITVPGTPAEEKESLLCVPLISREEIIGVMTLGRLGFGVFTDRDLQLLTLFAGQVAGSIENARLFDRVLSSVSLAEEHRRKLDAIFTSISDALIVTDTGLHIIEANPAAEKMLGRKTADIVNRHVRSIIETSALHEIFEEARARLETEPVAEFEFASRAGGEDRKGKYYRVLVDAVTGAQGEKVGYVATFRDITEAQDLAILKENFIANVSHELRTPLTSIIGSSELILADDRAHSFPYYSFVNIIDKEARRLRELVESLLDFSLLESGRLELSREIVNLNDIVAEVVKRHRPTAAEHDIALHYEPSDSLPETYADPRLISTAVSSLVKNAVQFNTRGSWVKITTADRDGNAVITVSDGGRGIPTEQLENIFSKFYQIDGSSTRAVGGTGLGLTIAKRVAEAHGGRIDVSSTPGEGSVFAVIIPFELPPPPKDPQ